MNLIAIIGIGAGVIIVVAVVIAIICGCRNRSVCVETTKHHSSKHKKHGYLKSSSCPKKRCHSRDHHRRPCPPAFDGVPILESEGVLTPAQIMTLSSNPSIIVPAVANKTIQFVYGHLRFTPGATPYTGTGGGFLYASYLKTDPALSYSGAAFNSATKDLVESPVIRTHSMGQDASYMGDNVGLPLYLRSNAGPDPVAGNGFIQYRIGYRLLDWT